MMAAKVGVDASAIAGAQASRATVATQAKNADKKAMQTLSEGLLEEVYTLSKDFKILHPTELKQVLNTAVKAGGFVEKWRDHIATKMREAHRQEWESITNTQHPLLYVMAAKAIASDEKETAGLRSLGKRPQRESETAADEETLFVTDDEEERPTRHKRLTTRSSQAAIAVEGSEEEENQDQSRRMLTSATALRSRASRRRLVLEPDDADSTMSDIYDGPGGEDVELPNVFARSTSVAQPCARVPLDLQWSIYAHPSRPASMNHLLQGLQSPHSFAISMQLKQSTCRLAPNPSREGLETTRSSNQAMSVRRT